MKTITAAPAAVLQSRGQSPVHDSCAVRRQRTDPHRNRAVPTRNGTQRHEPRHELRHEPRQQWTA